MYKIREIRQSMISHKNFILIFLAFVLSVCCLGSHHTTEFSYTCSSADSLQSRHGTSRPLLPVAYLIHEEDSGTKSSTISGIRYRNILDEIQSQKRFRHLSRLLSAFVGVIFTDIFSFCTEKRLKRIQIQTYYPFLTHIIRYIHNQDGEKAASSPVHF